MALKAEAKATLTVTSGMLNLTAYVPDRLGWSLSYTDSKGHALDMGMLRLYLSPELNGFMGASVQVEGQLQVVTSGDQQLVAGQPGGRLPRFRERRTTGAAFHGQMAAEDEGLQLSTEAFVGARGEGSLKGGVQWLKPTPPADIEASVAGLLKSSGQFVDFCSIGSNIGGMLGLGAGGKFYCTFINGKFCFHVAASICYGAGAKGGFICEVSAKNIVEFGAWLVYQLYRLDYSFFDVMDKEAFKTYTNYCILQVGDVGDDVYEVYDGLRRTVSQLSLRFDEFVKGLISENKSNLDASRRRNQLAAKVSAYPQRLLSYTPEAKGILLYLLTRHGTWDHLDYENRGKGWIPDLYQERKEAVNWVLKSIQTRAEWRKVLCRMTADGVSLSQDDNESAVVEQQEQQLIKFLQEGINQDQELYKAKGELTAIYDRLKETVAWGYALAMNNTEYYALNRAPNPHYPQRCTFGPCEEQSKLMV